MDFFPAVTALSWQHAVMWLIGLALIYLAIARRMEPALLLPMGFGAIAVNLPFSGMTDALEALYTLGITQNELMPLLLFLGVGAMIDFSPLLAAPGLALFGAAAQAGIFAALGLARLLGFPLNDAAAVAVIGAADGPTAIYVANALGTRYTAAILVVAYSYMALVPIVQPPIIRLLTTARERRIRMENRGIAVSRRAKIAFPILTTLAVGLLAPSSAALIGFLMFGNLLRECGVLERLGETARQTLANLITLLLGLTVSVRMQAAEFLRPETLLILGLGLVAFAADTAGGVLLAKVYNLFARRKINPMLGAAGISAFPMAARVVQKLGQAEDSQNFLLMHAVAVNVSGQIASILAGGILLSLVKG